MIKNLKLHNVGPAPEMEFKFADRLNLITGDNGLGKSFLLDIAWWCLTRKWPGEVNQNLTVGKRALPRAEGDAAIDFSITGSSGPNIKEYSSSYQRREQAWTGKQGRPVNPGFVFYAMADGSFSLWDPARNYWRTRNGVDEQDRPSAYVFSPVDVWNGLQDDNQNWLCEGLIRDWASWQKENGVAFKSCKDVLQALSPNATELLIPGGLTRISLDDVRDMPTLRMPYGQDVPVVHASSGMKRIIALAYFLVWSWQEHLKAKQLLGETPANQVIFLVDEVESHLHPKWQRSIIPALLTVMKELSQEATIQMLAVTHSPLIMASVEPIFDPDKDSWFDMDLVANQVELTAREFEKHGDSANWLVSNAFDMKSGRALEYEKLVEEASRLLDLDPPQQDAIQAMHQKLVEALNPKDDFLYSWCYVARKKGWLP